MDQKKGQYNLSFIQFLINLIGVIKIENRYLIIRIIDLNWIGKCINFNKFEHEKLNDDLIDKLKKETEAIETDIKNLQTSFANSLSDVSKNVGENKGVEPGNVLGIFQDNLMIICFCFFIMLLF